MKHVTRVRSVCAFLLATGIAAPVWGEDSGGSPSAVDEIIVTSTRREENVQRVPVAVTVISGAYLNAAQPQNLLDATGLAPNLFIGQQTAGPGLAAIYSRGLGYADIEKTQSPAVGVSVDGVSFGTSTGQLVDLFDVSQIEINRGPQGLLFGKNTTGGAIEIKRSRPTDQRGARAQFSYGTFDEYGAKAVLNSGRFFGDLAALKLHIGFRQSDGYYGNLYNGETLGDVETLSFHAGLAIDPSEDLSIYLVFDRVDDESEAPPVQAENTLSQPGVPGANGLDPHDTLADIDQPTDFETTRISAELNWRTPMGVVTSISGFVRSTDDVTQDFDATCVTDLENRGCAFNGNPRFGLDSLHIRRDQSYRQFSQELRLATDWSERLRSIVGVYYFEGSVDLDQLTDLSLGFITSQVSSEDVESIAYFGQLEFDLTETVSVSGGLRYISEDKDFESQFDALSAVAPLTPGGLLFPMVPFFEDHASFSELITRFSVDWQAGENHLVYLTRAEGFRSGGFSIRATLSELQPFESNFGTERLNTFLPEEITTYELGSKNTFMAGAVTLNLAAFYQELENQQANFVVNTIGGAGTNTYNNNFQETEGWGVEAEGAWVTPIASLTLSGTFGWQDIEIEKALVDARRLPVGPPRMGAPPNEAGSASQGLIDLSELSLSRTPKFSSSISAIFERELANGMSIGAQLTFRYQDDFTLANLGNLPDVEDGYGQLDASAHVQVSKRVRIGLFGRNLADETYRANALPSLGFQRFARPRTIFGQVTFEF